MRSDLTEFQPRHHIDTSGSDVFSPYDHQTAAWDALDRHFGSLQQKSGILVVPTGGGKTASATRWLTQHHIAKGGRVLWFAHRQILLKQAFRAMSALGATAGEPPALPSVLSLSGLARAFPSVLCHKCVARKRTLQRSVFAALALSFNASVEPKQESGDG